MDEEYGYAYAGLNPNALNDRGYECPNCGNVPTNRELDSGICMPCNLQRRIDEAHAERAANEAGAAIASVEIVDARQFL